MNIALLLLAAVLVQDPQPPIPRPGSGELDLAPLAQRQGARAPQTSGAAIVTVFEQVYPNWTPTCDAAGIAGHRIAFDLTLDPNGRIVAGPTPVRPRQDASWRAAADSARRALIRSAPFEVPPGFTGGRYRPTFVTARACARAAAAEADED